MSRFLLVRRLLLLLPAFAATLPAAPAATLVATNATWAFHRGRTEASSPDPAAWRARTFNDAGWERGRAPFYYGEPLSGTLLSDMQGGYASVFLRVPFSAGSAGQFESLRLRAVCDDGFIAWINGVRVAAYNAPAEPFTRQSLAPANAPEPVQFADYELPDPAAYLVAGENVLAVQVFNNTLTSSDLVFDAALEGVARVSGAPVVAAVAPPPGIVADLTQVTVTFSEPVTGVTARHFLVNGASAWSVSGAGATYTFSFPRPAYGTVSMAWAPDHEIADLEVPPQRFDVASPGATWAYELADPEGPAVTQRLPPPGFTVSALRQVAVAFDKPVLGVDAADLRVNGVPATNVTGFANGPYYFDFPAVPAGPATVSWAPDAGIFSDAVEPKPFAGGSWNYTVEPGHAPPGLRITELMAENYTALKDEDQDPEDWIEIHNPTAAAVDLHGWSLSDDPDEPGLWVFPPTVIAPNGRLVVWASAKDRRPLGAGQRHTNFKLNANGERVTLYGPELPRTAVSEVRYPEQRPDYSWGLQAASADAWRYFPRGTPGAPNGFSGLTGVVDMVHFSVPRGFFPSAFNLSLHCATPGAVIRWTTNGAPPTEATGFIYEGPVAIPGPRVVRAAAFATNLLPSRVQTHTYLVGLAPTRLRLPALSLVTATNHLFGPSGIMEVNPRNTNKRGPAWERPVSVEFLRPEDNGGFAVEAGLRIQGGDYIRSLYDYRSGSPPQNKYSFRLYFRGEYGEGRLRFPLFPGTTQRSFDTIVLRAGMNDHTNPYLIDEYVRSLAADTGQPTPLGTFVHLFLNGRYLGYYNPCERIDIDFLRAYHGGGERWDLIAQMGEVREGDATAWNTLKALCNNTTRPLTVEANYRAVADRLDLVNFCDYLLPLIWADMDDWPHNNWRAARERVPGAKFRFYTWDAEWGFGFVNGHGPSFNTIANQLSSTSPPWGSIEIQQIFNALKRAPEFQLLMADRVHRHFFNDGALTDARLRARYNDVRGRLNNVVAGFNDRIGQIWIPQRRTQVLRHLHLAGFHQSSNAPAFTPFGGRVAPGHALVVTNLAGTIWYTTNGTDPRVPFTGAVHPDARAYTAPLTLAGDLHFRARTLDGTNWSALSEAVFQVGALAPPIRFSELMYNPPGGDAYEYLELLNAGGAPVDLSGWSFEGVNFRIPTPFPPLAPGARLVFANGTATNLFRQRYGAVPVAGWYSGALANGGERLALLDRAGRVITAVTYGNAAPWPSEAAGGGSALELLHPNGEPSDPANWFAGPPNGTPGAPPAAPPETAVRFSEVFATAQDAPDFIELEATGAVVNLAGWTLHRPGRPAFTFPAGTQIPAGGHLTVWCDTGGGAGLRTGWRLDRGGDSLWLNDAAGRRVDVFTYGPQATGWSVARVAGAWVVAEPTPGGSNEPAVTAPAAALAINEWLANPLPGDDDWLELHNTDVEAPASLAGIYLGTSNALFRLTLPGAIAPSGFARLWADNSSAPGRVGFRLPAAASAIWLYDETGAELSKVTWLNQPEGVTHGRVPDGTGLPILLPGAASPGASNYLQLFDGPRLNEFLADHRGAVTNPAGVSADFIELFNPAPTNILLNGHSLSVGRARPGEWRFPDGTVLPAGGHLVVWADPDRPASTNPAPVLQLGRGLPREGSDLWLFNERGQALDRVRYGFQLPGRSAGRLPGGAWTLLEQPTPGAANAPATPLGNPWNARLNEWLASNPDGHDFLEVFNPEDRPVDLGGFGLTDDPSLAGRTNHLIPTLTFLAPGGHGLWHASGDASAGPDHLPFALNVRGETIRLLAPGGGIVDSVDFTAQSPGVSEGRLPDGATNLVRFAASVSPGTPNWLPHPDLAINEVLTHTDPPLEDAVEITNLGTAAVSLAGWWLSDDARQPRKYALPAGAAVPAGGFHVVLERAFNAAAQGTNAFAFSSSRGGAVWLSEADDTDALTGRRVFLPFPPLPNGEAFGRVQTSVGADWAPLSARTFGAANAPARVGPVVISEIHYQPMTLLASGPTEQPAEEFLELHNLTAAPVPLFDPAAPTNTWRVTAGMDFTFPPGVTLPAGGFAVLVRFNPADAAAAAVFRANFGVPAGVPLFGPFSGRLANEGEELRLERPDTPQGPGRPDAGLVPYVPVDRVHYAPAAPWPAEAAGTGASLQRRQPGLYGNDPAHWLAAAPTPGRPTASPGNDRDNDGMPDDWELLYGFNPDDPSDALEDADGDGMSNVFEYLSGTDPRDAASFLRVDIAQDATGTHLLFRAVAGRSYTLLYRDAVSNGPWRRLRDVPVAGVNRDLRVPDPDAAAAGERYYRLVTPALPAGME